MIPLSPRSLDKDGQAFNDLLDQPVRYQIRLEGILDRKWADWFDGFMLSFESVETTLVGPVSDQSALHGVIAKIRDLGLPIVSLQRVQSNE